VEVRVLGPLELVDTDGGHAGADGGQVGDGRHVVLPGAKMRGLLVLLALEAGRVVPVERIVDALSGDEIPQRATNAIQQLVSKLRRALPPSGADAVVTRAPGYLLDVPSSAVDALRFERLLGDGRAAAATGDHLTATVVLSEALGLWRGDALVDVPFEGAVAAARTRLEELRLSANEDRADAELALGRHDGLVAELEAMVQAEPLRERRWGQLMLALYRSGRQADALRAYQRARAELAEQLGIDPGPELRRLEQAVLAQDDTLAAPASPLPVPVAPAAGAGDPIPAVAPPRRAVGPGRVRRPLTACLGRDDAIARVGQLVSRERLVTLVGPGGAGKTRLAVEVALALGDRVPDGVWWVELAPVRSTGVAPAVGRALGLDSGPGRTGAEDELEVLAAALEARSAVLALDNCEHVVDEVAALVDELLARAPQLRVVATSREGLGVPGEVVFPVPPLADDAAVTLFTERATATGVDLVGAELGPTGPVVEICRRLDGLPLAIELAAARARHVGVDELARRLDQRFEILTDGPRVAQPRQRTLRAVIDWSYELLSEPERELFERLGVFAGPVGLDAIVRVCADGSDAVAVERLLGLLVDKSLVVVDRSTSPSRFGMLQTLSEYARDRLRERGADVAVRERHAAWIRDRAAEVDFDVGAPDLRARLAELERDDAEIRQAIAWATKASPVVALEICSGLGWSWFVGLRARTAWSAHTAALDAAPDASSDLRSRVAAFAGVAGDMCGQPTASAHAEMAVAHERERGDPGRLGLALLLRGVTLALRTEAKASLPILDEARACFTAAGHERGLGYVRLAEGSASLALGDAAASETALREAGEVFREHGEHLGTLAVLIRLSDLAYRSHRYEESLATLEEILSLGGPPAIMSIAHSLVAVVRTREGRRDEARRAAAMSMAEAQEGFAPITSGFARYASGMVRLAEGDRHSGRVDLEAAIAHFSSAAPAMASTCWLELSRSWESDDLDRARECAGRALELGLRTDDAHARQAASDQAARLSERT
jgi:predicted ATPase/DNA-binding SARP family transcriptional activator